MKEKECKEQGQYTIHRCALNKSEYLLTASIKLGAGDSRTAVFQAYQDLVQITNDLKAEIVLERVFGELSFKTEVEEIRQRLGLSGKDKCPLSYIQGCPLKGHGIAGIQMHIVAPQNARIWTVYDNGRPCGRGWERDGVQWFVLQDMHG